MNADEANTQSALYQLWRTSTADNDFAPLVAFLQAHPTISQLCEHEYPSVHRLSDFIFDNRPFRMCRCASCGERLFLFPLTCQAGTVQGVPFALTGEALQQWIADETANPAEDDDGVDWSRYLHPNDRNA